MSGVLNFLKQAEDKLILGLESESAGSEEEFSDISTSLARVGIKREESMQLTDGVGGKDGVL